MIHKSTLNFLSDLLRNNNREWFTENKPQYESAKEDVLNLSGRMIELINKFDPSIGFSNPRKTIFRINRDTRFSKNKDPYKTYFGIIISPQGSTSCDDSGYYIHVEPGASFLADGIYMSSPAKLKMIRESIDSNWDEFSTIISNPKFVKTFEGISRDCKTLKRAPKGFSEDSPAIEYLRLCACHVVHPVSDKMLLSKDFCEQAAEIFKIASPLNDFLNRQ